MSDIAINTLSASQAATQKAQNVADANAFNDLKTEAKEDPKKALRAVAEQFEALFLQQIMKESRKVSFDDGWLDGGQSDMYKDWHDSQLSQSLSTKGSLGLADSIVEQLSPQFDRVYTPEQFEQLQQTDGVAQNVSDSKQKLNPDSTQAVLSLRALNQ